MTTTELIDLLKKYEHGGATGRPREITLKVNGTFMPYPHFYVSSTDDGLYTGICIGVSGDVEDVCKSCQEFTCDDCKIWDEKHRRADDD